MAAGSVVLCRGIAAKFTGSTAEGKAAWAGGGNEVRGEQQAKEGGPEKRKTENGASQWLQWLRWLQAWLPVLGVILFRDRAGRKPGWLAVGVDVDVGEWKVGKPAR